MKKSKITQNSLPVPFSSLRDALALAIQSCGCGIVAWASCPSFLVLLAGNMPAPQENLGYFLFGGLLGEEESF